VKNDKSMTSLVNNGQSWMEPMMALEICWGAKRFWKQNGYKKK
jgi:hypothetical protein